MNQKNKRRKVCLVSVLPPLHSGVSLYTVGLLSGFEKLKLPYELVVVANKSAADIASSASDLRLVRTWSRGLKYIFQVLQAVIKEKCDVIHLQHEFFLFGGMFTAALFPFLLLSLRLLRIRTVVTIHGVIPKNAANDQFAEAFFVPKNYFLLRVGLGSITTMIGKLANTVIVHSNSAKDVLNSDYGISPGKIRVVHHGVGFSESDNQMNSTENTVLFFGNITPSKGLELLISAFEKVRVPNAKLVIAGGPHPRGKKYFQKIVQTVQTSEKSDKIVITGYVTDEEIHRLFDQCKIAVFPYTFSVSCSGGLSFALQHRKPSIVTSLPSFTEIITDGSNGLVVPPNDEVALTQAIEHLLLDRYLQERLSQGIVRDCGYLSWSEIAGETITCY